MAELEVKDPIVRTTTTTLDRLEDAYSFALEHADYNDSTWSNQQADLFATVTNDLAHLTSCFLISHDGELGLQVLMSEIEHFGELYRTALECLAGMISVGDYGPDPKAIAVILNGPKRELAELEARVKSLTPTHVALQGHFENFVYGGPTARWIGDAERDRLYTPAMTLRDDYFTKPSASILTEYLAEVEETRASPRYSASGSKLTKALNATKFRTYGERLEAYALELEVLSLLEIMETSQAVATDEE
jgi:hypothetical protein